MSCCETRLRGPRNADLVRAYALTAYGDAVDLTGWTAAFNVYTAPGSAAILSLSPTPTANGSSVSVSGLAPGTISLTLAKADIATLPVGVPTTSPALLYYDLLLEDTSGITTRFLCGCLIIDPIGGGYVGENEDQLSFELAGTEINISVGTALVVYQTGAVIYGFPQLADAPSEPFAGQAYFDTTLGFPRIFMEDGEWHGFVLG